VKARAVITGAGAVSPLGVGLHALFDGLAAGRVAVGTIRTFDARTFPVRVAGEVPLDPLGPGDSLDRLPPTWLVERLGVPSAAAWVDRWHASGVLRDRKSVFAALAAAEAWRDAGLDDAGAAWLSLGVGLPEAYLGDFAACFDGERLDFGREDEVGLAGVRFRSRVDLAPDVVAELLDLGGPVIVNASACAAGALAVAHAASLVERGEAEVVLCGAVDSMVNPLGLGGMGMLGATSARAAPDACRPFDSRRDGIAIGEGAALFVVEDEERARARGARVRARVLGSGSSQDAYKPSAPEPTGASAARAVSAALSRARVDPSSVAYVNAHGTGTPLNDVAEVRALRAAGLGRAALSSIKGAIGHLMAASGAIELAACLLAFERGLLPGTAHLELVDPECDADVIGPAPRAARPELVLSTSFGFGGQNAAVLLGAP
jgi:3-oxoacyl-[acyl-carrier-protein] synthase II